ncbi:septation regulator SpoVG [Natranaerobius trueperi]|uniref:Septation protein SpoVG n=1 Tax=Natranaerobius trueperi TaxID=759412 RepID=A0A226BZW8_9FIRM|nr:septation regulator SpoVG [Natranaerobius trueperi]OWZ83660.1 hypothetical protein CDO51_07515 [Natranaerobius trueperi]
MEISDVKIYPMQKDGKVKALVSIILADSLAIHGIKIIEGKNGLFVAMPSRKTKNDEYKDIVHPTNNELRQKIQSKILEAYQG